MAPAQPNLNDSALAAITAALRGEALPAAGDLHALEAALLVQARQHGVAPLLLDRLHQTGSAPQWPAAVLAQLREDTLAAAAREMSWRRDLTDLLAALAARGVRPLLLKGAPLAHTHYRQPHLRTRSDTDILITPDARPAAEAVLRDLGYACAPGADHVHHTMQQTAWSLAHAPGHSHQVDLHWRANNAPALAQVLTYEDMIGQAQAVPALGPHAWAPGPVHALLYACIHRAGHSHLPFYAGDDDFRGGDRLIWLCDIDLLLRGMSPALQAEWVNEVTARQARAICLDALQATKMHLGTPLLAPELLAALTPSSADTTEASAAYLRTTAAHRLWHDLRHTGGWSGRAGWLMELAFPPHGHMRQKYPHAPGWSVPVLYGLRAMSGIAKLLRRPSPGKSGR